MPDHIKLQRAQSTTPRRPAIKKIPPVAPPTNANAYFGRSLRSIQNFVQNLSSESVGYDDRHLIRLKLNPSFMIDKISKIEGITIVEQDEAGVLLAFASSEALAKFEARLTALMRSEEIGNAEFFYALEEINSWTSDDRLGTRLRIEGRPEGYFSVDVELWTIDGTVAEIRKLRTHFEAVLLDWGIQVVDSLIRIPYYRLKVNGAQLDKLLNHRDVRLIDMLPTYGINMSELYLPISDFPEVQPPDPGSGFVAVLDTGITTGHPLLRNAIADNQSFLPNIESADNHGHGTRMAGVALYGDVKAAIEARQFTARLFVLSGRVLDDNCEYEGKIILNSVIDAVRYFKEAYGCLVYNLSLGDRKLVYDGGRMQAFAVGLDQVARDEGVLFVIAAGNIVVEELFDRGQLKDVYPSYLAEVASRIIDPATSINNLSVGSICEYDRPVAGRPTIEKMPIAKRYDASPFTRSGPSIRGAIKPDFVDFGGNYCYHVDGDNRLGKQELGQVSLRHDFATRGNLFGLSSGTSEATPRVAHLAARLTKVLENPRADTLRAVLGAHSRYPQTDNQRDEFLLGVYGNSSSSQLSKLYGLGQIRDEWLFTSGDEAVTLYAEDKIENNENHFYELPLPDEFLTGGKRLRRYNVSLAHSPAVRQSRLDYTLTRIKFRLKIATSLDEVSQIYSDPDHDETTTEHTIGSNIDKLGPLARDRGTLQVARFSFKGDPKKIRTKKLFLIVTRQDRAWAKGSPDLARHEPYSIAMHIEDREAASANLYANVTAQLEVRVRERARS